MVRFTKKMVKGIISIITSEPCKNRPALQSMRIRRDGYAYITNGYIVIRYKFETEVVPVDDKQEEFIIPASSLVYWYHNAKATDYLSELSILDLQSQSDQYQYPSIEELFAQRLKLLPMPETRIMKINGLLLEQFCKCAGNSDIKIQQLPDGIYVESIQEEKVDGIIMGLN